jgi:uncharacterized repeat protein (TIGR01451 family)
VKRFEVTAMLIVALVWGTISAIAAPGDGKVELKMAAEKEIEVTGANGEKIVQRVPAEKVIPGDEVIYTITYVNNGDEPAENLVVKNPIPEHMKYVAGSATGESSVITYSVDNGKSFDAPEKLTVKDAKGNMAPAKSTDYTNIRWTLSKSVAPKTSGLVSFRARLE